jgi:Big-like domain-containing protein
LKTLARVTSRVVAGGATAALATAALVGVTASTASAASAATTYACTVPGQPAFNVPVSVDIALLPPTAPAGYPVAAGLFGYNSTLTIPDAVQQQLTFFVNNTGAKSDDFGPAFGDAVTKAPVAWTKPAAATAGNFVYTGKGANTAFALPEAGTYDVSMPKTFTLVTTGGSSAITATCTNPAPTKIATIELSKQKSKVKATATPKSAAKGAVVTVKGKVTNEFVKTGGPEVTGKVIIKDGKKKIGTVTIKKGKFVAKVKGLAVGSHTLTALYKGDGYSDKAVSKALKVTITS